MLSQQSKQKWNKIKIGIFTAMILLQNFCLHSILLFFKSYPEIESTWPTAKCRRIKSFNSWYYIVTCAMFCVSFSSKSKAINVFPKHSEIKSMWPINSSKEEMILSCEVKNYLSNVLWKFCEICEIKEQAPQLTLQYRGRTVGGSHQRWCIRNLFLTHGKHLCRNLFLKNLQTFRPATLLKGRPNTGAFLWILQNFYWYYLFRKTSANSCFLIFSMVHSYMGLKV